MKRKQIVTGLLAKWAKYGHDLSIIAGLFYISFQLMFGRFLSGPLITMFSGSLVLVGAILMRTRRSGLKILGGALVVCFSLLWWSVGMGGWSGTFKGFIVNLSSPMGGMSCVGLILGITGGVLGIAEGVRLSQGYSFGGVSPPSPN